jgi:hypothetical protein
LDQLSERKKFQTDSITTVIKKKTGASKFHSAKFPPPNPKLLPLPFQLLTERIQATQTNKNVLYLTYRWIPLTTKKNTAQIPNSNLLLSATHLCKSLPNKWHPVPPRTKRSAEASLSGAVPEVRSMEQHDQQILKNVVACRVLIT